MNTSIRVAIIIALAFFTAYAQAAAKSPHETHLAHLSGSWQIVSQLGDERLAYAATASYSAARHYLRVDLHDPRGGANPRLTWIIGYDKHNGEYVCYSIDDEQRTRGPLYTRFAALANDTWQVSMHGKTDARADSEYTLRRT
jgi:hypothetical protein